MLSSVSTRIKYPLWIVLVLIFAFTFVLMHFLNQQTDEAQRIVSESRRLIR